MTPTEIQNVFQSRNPVARGGKGLYGWYASMANAGVITVLVEDYDASVPRPASTQLAGNEGDGHLDLTHWARLRFAVEGRSGRSRDMLGYGTCDHSTLNRVIECGSTPPVKLLRSWAIGFDKFTVFPFPHLMGHKCVTFLPACDPWPLKPPSGWRASNRNPCKTIGGGK